MAVVIEVNNLYRQFTLTEGLVKTKKRIVHALQGIAFQVEAGMVFGLLGPNGAGKTTTIKILTTLLLPSSGSAFVLGKDVSKEAADIRPYINFIFGGERSLYWRLSAEDNLKYFADLYQIDYKTQKQRVPELLDMVGLSDRAKTKVETFSKGMKQRLQIARGLINNPKVIFLDEPTVGLDPEASIWVRELIKRLKEKGVTTLLTTHYMLEADLLCDQIGIINHGNLIAMDTPQGLKQIAEGWTTIEVRTFGVKQDFFKNLETLPNVKAVNQITKDQDQIIYFQTKQADDSYSCIINYLSDHDIKILDVKTRQSTLEDAYLKLIGGQK